MKPALTREEWFDGEFGSRYCQAETSLQVDHKGRLFAVSEGPGGYEAVVVLNEAQNREALHKTAALCLHGQPFGFTREDVRLLRSTRVSAFQQFDHAARDATQALVDSLADRIEALLPPEDDGR